jgi:hypothetical protein
MNKPKRGRPKGAKKKLVGVWLDEQTNYELHHYASERGMTLSAAAEFAIRNLLHPSDQKTETIKSKPYHKFAAIMNQKLLEGGGQTALTVKELNTALSRAGIIPRNDQRKAYVSRYVTENNLLIKIVGNQYVFQKQTPEKIRPLSHEEIEGAVKEADMERMLKEQKEQQEQETKKDAEPTAEDWQKHQEYLRLAAEAEKRRDEELATIIDRKIEEQARRYEQFMQSLKQKAKQKSA